MARAVFFDRDGTLIEEKGFLGDPEEVSLIPGAVEALKIAKAMGFLRIVISNQSGVGRGYFGIDEVKAVNKRLEELLREKGTEVEDFFFCPHAPEEDCMCRKPRPGLLLEASLKYAIDLKSSYMIGDREGDVGAIASMGGKAILVLTGYGEETWRRWRFGHKPNFVARDVLEGVYWILAKEIEGGRIMLDEDLLQVLVCPRCKGGLVNREEGFLCPRCKLLYPIEDGIPIMLPEEAESLEEGKNG